MKSQFQQTGYFGGRFTSTFTKYEGFDFSRRGFVFPGQSAAFPGMLKDELADSPVAAAVFKAADDLATRLELPVISDYVFQHERLSNHEKSIVRNPALFTVQVAVARHLESIGLTPALVTGHSFGEYAAAVVSGIGTFETLFEIVVMRDRFSPPAKTLGVMIVAGASPGATIEALGGIEAYVSNVNSPEQVVVSVRTADELHALAALKNARIAAKTLKEMNQPYHTPWMESVSIQLEEFINSKNYKFSAPRVPMISSVNAEVLTQENFAVKNQDVAFARRLARQVQAPVLFPDQIALAIKLNVLNFIEIGAGDICGSFIKKTLGETLYKVTPLSRYLISERKRSAKVTEVKAGTLGLLSKVIAAVTGYNVEEISVHDNFQEDLGIDSIRKAEIVFKFMESMNASGDPDSMLHVNLTQLKRVEDVIEHFQSQAPAEAPSKRAQSNFKRFREKWVPAPIGDFEKLNDNTWPISFHRMSQPPPSDWSDETTFVLIAGEADVAEDPRSHYENRIKPWLDFFRGLGDRRVKIQVALLTTDRSDPYFAGFDGLLKSWLREDAIYAFRHIHGLSTQDLAALESIVRDEFRDFRFTDILYKNGIRFAQTWEPAATADAKAPTLSPQPTIVSFGGARGIGQEILAASCRHFPGCRLYFFGRSSEESSVVQNAIERFRAAGASVTYEQVDVTQTSKIKSALRLISEKHGAIDILLNAAGQEFSRSLAAKSDAEIWEEFTGKVSPATAIYQASHEIIIHHVLNFSSVAASFGSPGQTIYALGNQIQVAIGKHCAPGTTVTNLVLPPWNNLGMTEKENILKGLKAAGVSLLEKEVGVQLVLEEILARHSGSVALLDATDLRAYDRDLTDRRAWEGIFSRSFTTSAPMTVVSLNLRDQAYLCDHLINGNVIYPGSSAMGLMFYVGYHYFKRAPRLENFEVKSFLAPERETSSCELQIQIVESGRLRLQLSSKRVVHFVADVVDEAERLEPVALPDFSTQGRIDHEPLYENDHIRFGPSFQLAHAVYFNDRRELMISTRQSQFARCTSNRPFDRLQQWFESTLQVMGSQLLWNTKKYWVPSRIGSLRMRLDLPLTDVQTYRTSIASAEQGVATAKTYSYNDRGQVVIEIAGVEAIDVGGGDAINPVQIREVQAEGVF